MAGDPDLAGILRDRPARVSQQFSPRGTVTLLCPPDGAPEKYQNLQIAFGPFTGAVLAGAYEVGIQSRMDELDDLWAVILSNAFPTKEQRMPGGAPRASTRTAALGWRLLATVGSAIETLTGIADAIDHWRGEGQPTGSRCTIGSRLLNFSTSGADSVAGGLSRSGTNEAAATLFGYPTVEIMSRHVTTGEAEVIARRCERSAGLAAAIFRASAGVVEDPFWRTFMKWKHGIAVTSPGVAPLWVPDTPDLDVGRTQSRLETGIVVFDTKPGQSIYVWPLNGPTSSSTRPLEPSCSTCVARFLGRSLVMPSQGHRHSDGSKSIRRRCLAKTSSRHGQASPIAPFQSLLWLGNGTRRVVPSLAGPAFIDHARCIVRL